MQAKWKNKCSNLFRRFFAFSGSLPLALFHSIEGDVTRCSPRFPDQRPIDELFINESILRFNNTRLAGEEK